MKRLSLVLPLLLLLSACGGGPAQPTPTGGVPTGGLTGQPTGGATQPPNAGAGFCRILTAAEVGAVVGETVTVTETGDTSCTFSAAMAIPSINVRTETGESLDIARMILTNPEDVTVAGNPAVFGEFAGHLLYISKGGNLLVFQAIWGEEDRNVAKTKLLQLAETAIGRFPLP